MNPQTRETLFRVLRGIWRVICKIGRTLWEGICWLIVPTVFGYLCYASITKKFEISVLHISLAAIALSPWIIRLVSHYLSEFNFGLTGVSGKIKEAVRNKGEIDGNEPTYTANERISDTIKSPLWDFLPQAKMVLRTLWKFQVEHFGPDDIRRWGFGVSPKAPDYHEFALGITQPLMQHLAYLDSRGFVFLTNSGVEFCKQNNKEITAYPFYYSNFSN